MPLHQVGLVLNEKTNSCNPWNHSKQRPAYASFNPAMLIMRNFSISMNLGCNVFEDVLLANRLESHDVVGPRQPCNCAKNISDSLGPPFSRGKSTIAVQNKATKSAPEALAPKRITQGLFDGSTLKNAPNAVSIATSMAVIAPTLISAAAIHPSVRSRIHWALDSLSLFVLICKGCRS